MYKIALTGGIGSGKSTASKLFAKLGIEIIDADLITNKLLENKKLQNKIIKLLKLSYFNKKTIKNIIFNNQNLRNKLEKIVHPLILKAIDNNCNQSNSIYTIVSIPLLFEKHLEQQFDRILLIKADYNKRIEVITKRDQISKELAIKITESQLNDGYKEKHSDDIIENHYNLQELEQNIIELDKKYKTLALQNDK